MNLYPKYKRKEKLNAKLSDEDIEQINLIRAGGMTLSEIALLFDVCVTTIWWAIQSDERRKELFRNLYQKNPKGNLSKVEKLAAQRRWEHRKRILYGEEYKKNVKEYRKSNFKYRQNAKRRFERWIKNNREYMQGYQKKYYQKRKLLKTQKTNGTT